MTVNNEDSVRVSDAGCASPANMNATTATAVQLKTRLATSREIVTHIPAECEGLIAKS
jgi:hypothetical protein